MTHIQRGDTREVFTNVATKSADYSGAISGINNVLNASINVAEVANQSKLANHQIDLANEALKLNNEINTKYQADPTNPEREREFNEGFELLSQKYKVNPLVQGRWNEIKGNVLNNYKQYNAKWQIEQQRSNAQTDLKQGYEKLIDQVSMMGNNNASIDEVRLVYNNGIESLRNGANAVLGSVVTESFLNDANHDYMASYIGALAMNNPLQAQALMKDQGVLNDIGNAETIEKLNNYIGASFAQQSKKEAVNQLGNSLRALGSDEATNLLNGNASFNQVMRFVERNKNIPEGSKEMLLGIYGIGSKTKYFYNKDTKKIEKAKEGGSGESLGNLKLTKAQKEVLADTLQTELHEMLEVFDENSINPKDLKSSKQREAGEQVTIGYMKKIANMQGRIDTAYATGAISESERNKYINDFILPASDFVEANLKELDEGKLFVRGGFGYDSIKKAFNTEDLKGEELRNAQKQKLFAQNYYLDELHKTVRKSEQLKTIYDIETKLTPEQKREVYKTASENAIKRAQRWTNNPTIFFAKEFPDVYSVPFLVNGQAKALEINRTVAEAVYKEKYEGKNDIELKDIAKSVMWSEIEKEAKYQRRKAGEILLNEIDSNIHMADPKNSIEMNQRLRNKGIEWNEFEEWALREGYISDKTSKGNWQGYIQAFRDVSRLNAMKNRK